MTPADDHLERLRILYEQNAAVASTFWDWRYKVMTYFSAGLAPVFGVTGWLLSQTEESRSSLFDLAHVPLFVGAGFATVSVFLDRAMGKRLRLTYETGKELEAAVLAEPGGIFGAMHQPRGGDYTKAFERFYAAAAVLLFAAAIWVLVAL